MSDRLEAVLVSLRARFGADTATEELTAYLAAQGFDRRQIGEIVARFRADLAQRRRDDAPVPSAVRPASPPPVRVAGPHEWGRFTPEAWGRVLRLSASGLLTAPDLERLLERAVEQGEGRVDLAALHAVLDGVGLGDLGADVDPTTIH
jgi:uncharacterized protein Smg (DUF494 family)